MAKEPAKAKAAKPRLSASQREQKAAEQAAALAMTAAPDPQTGQTMTRPDDMPSRKQVEEARKAALESQFAAADEKGAPSPEEVADVTLRRAVGLGY